jgi:hypothetical protein
VVKYVSQYKALKRFSNISTDTVVVLRKRAFIGLLLYRFALVTAAILLNVENYNPQGKL